MRAWPASLRPFALALVGLTLVGHGKAETPLSKDSPFLPPSSAATAGASNENYELAAVSTIGKKTSVSVFDKQAKKGKWITVGETVDGISVTTYDAVREQAVVRVGGVEKVLTLRKGSSQNNGRVAATSPQLSMGASPGWNVQSGTASAAPSVTVSTLNAAQVAPTPTAPAVKQDPPPKPGSIAHQEQEARMLVSDLLEIGMAQRKAYEEAQKKAGEQSGQPAQPAQPTSATPPPSGEE